MSEMMKLKDIIIILSLVIIVSILQFVRSNVIMYEILMIASILTVLYLFYKTSFNLITLFLFFEFLMPPVPTMITLGPILFCVLGVLLLVKSIKGKGTVTVYNNNSHLLLIITGILTTIILYYSLIVMQNDITTVLTSTIPILLFMYFLFILNNMYYKNIYTLTTIFISVIIWGVLYTINNFSLLIYSLLIGNPLSYRITLLDFNTLSPVPLLVFALLMFIWISRKSPYVFMLIIFSFVGILLPLTRSYILAALFILVIGFVYLIKKVYLSKFIILLSTVLLGGIIGSSLQLFQAIVSRFDQVTEGDQNVSQRFNEYQLAVTEFEKSPIFGKGLGAEFSERNGIFVNYIHNFYFYILSNLGLFGILILIIILALIFVVIFQAKPLLIKGIMFGAFSILIYSFFFAVFKWFAFGIISGIIIWVILNYKNIESFLNQHHLSEGSQDVNS